MSSIKIANEAHWHELRKQFVGASESAALFGLLPWLTPWQLFMIKSNKLAAPDLEDVKHIKQGKLFEPAIAGWAAEKFGITLNKVRRYEVADDCPGMGASKDYEMIGTGKRVPTEIKWVVRKGDHWEYDGDQITAVPDYYVLQAQHQMGCDNYSEEAQLIAFIDGDVRRAVYTRREGMIAKIKERITEFWADVQADKEPAIDFVADADAVMRYAAAMPVRKIDWTPEVAALAKRASWMAGFAKRAEEQAGAAKAELTDMMIERATKDGMNDPESKIICEGDGFRITNYYVEANAGKEITADMLGTFIYVKKEFRVCKISRPKPKKTKQKDAPA